MTRFCQRLDEQTPPWLGSLTVEADPRSSGSSNLIHSNLPAKAEVNQDPRRVGAAKSRRDADSESSRDAAETTGSWPRRCKLGETLQAKKHVHLFARHSCAFWPHTPHVSVLLAAVLAVSSFVRRKRRFRAAVLSPAALLRSPRRGPAARWRMRSTTACC